VKVLVDEKGKGVGTTEIRGQADGKKRDTYGHSFRTVRRGKKKIRKKKGQKPPAGSDEKTRPTRTSRTCGHSESGRKGKGGNETSIATFGQKDLGEKEKEDDHCQSPQSFQKPKGKTVKLGRQTQHREGGGKGEKREKPRVPGPRGGVNRREGKGFWFFGEPKGGENRVGGDERPAKRGKNWVPSCND